MSRFLKLSKRILNVSHISEINIHNNSYVIHLQKSDIDLFLFGGSGVAYTSHCKINICSEKNADDYKIVSDWILDLEKKSWKL